MNSLFRYRQTSKEDGTAQTQKVHLHLLDSVKIMASVLGQQIFWLHFHFTYCIPVTLLKPHNAAFVSTIQMMWNSKVKPQYYEFQVHDKILVNMNFILWEKKSYLLHPAKCGFEQNIRSISE